MRVQLVRLLRTNPNQTFEEHRCVPPIELMSGMGSSLALQDAHVLAGYLSRNLGDISAALLQYEDIVTPIARRYQDNARSIRRLALDRSRVKAHVRDLFLRVVPERLIVRNLHRFFDAERSLADVQALAADERAATGRG